MSDMLKTGSDFLEAQRHRHMTGTVKYRHNGVDIDIDATAGKTEVEIQDESGMIVKAGMIDFLVRAEDLKINDAAFLPETTDTITMKIAGCDAVFMVAPIGAESHYRNSDSFGKTLRIHTKRI